MKYIVKETEKRLIVSDEPGSPERTMGEYKNRSIASQAVKLAVELEEFGWLVPQQQVSKSGVEFFSYQTQDFDICLVKIRQDDHVHHFVDVYEMRWMNDDGKLRKLGTLERAFQVRQELNGDYTVSPLSEKVVPSE